MTTMIMTRSKTPPDTAMAMIVDRGSAGVASIVGGEV